MKTNGTDTKVADDARAEGNQCIAMGLGVGGVGTVSAMALGATCPLCFIAAPALIGIGVYRRFTASRAASSNNQRSDDSKDPVGRS